MSTHIGQCVVCGGKTACCNDEHVLSSGRACCCDDDPALMIEFCSLNCFEELKASMTRREKVARGLYPLWYERSK